MWPCRLGRGIGPIRADGYGGQFLLVDTENNLAIAQRNFTGNPFPTSGLFLIRKRRRHGGRVHLMQIQDTIIKPFRKELI
ncbi:hypothetical protein [Sabulibacter ruber]|uniref:hypothetical protein n=1 Tax=Sabulibacter ruber TaxID=2811901 RepID=UPI001A963529|nr:hypothetical protein [Sabulibacter ruber]